ncbi:MFS transporter [Nocardiopsis changdeensis]|uniref:MFS transporter n=1 Tax=Nocardiopsis TaxID=2013 RepID=UPI002105E00C|nr:MULTISPECIES: MFS transporter [Nocardiopsis]
MDSGEPPPRPPLLRRYALFSLAATTADFAFGAVFITVLLGRGLDPGMLGAMVAAGTLFGLAAEAPSGALGDRYGHRRLLSLGLVVWGAGFALFGWADELLPTMVGSVLWSVGFHLHTGTLTALVVNRVGDRDRTARVARLTRWGQVSSRLGGVAGAASVLVAGTWLSADLLILAAGVLLVGLGAVAPLVFPRSPGRPDVSVAGLLRESVAALAGRRYVPLVALVLCSTPAKVVLVICWQPLVAREYGGDVRFNGLVLLGMTLALALGAACSRFVDPRNPHLWAPASAVATAVPLFLVAWGALPLLVGLVLAEFLLGLAQALFVAWEHLMYSDEARNTLFSVMSFLGLAVIGATYAVFGWAWDVWGLESAMVAVLAVSAAGSLAVIPLAYAFPESRRFFDPREGARAQESEPAE